MTAPRTPWRLPGAFRARRGLWPKPLHGAAAARGAALATPACSGLLDGRSAGGFAERVAVASGPLLRRRSVTVERECSALAGPLLCSFEQHTMQVTAAQLQCWCVMSSAADTWCSGASTGAVTCCAVQACTA
jgi:hypothetical protein